MISATRKWVRRNRTNFAIGFGVIGVTYLAGQYVVSKISETRKRMSSDRIARENLHRRFQHNQEDCTFTVLALLPTAADNILDALQVENITHELQQHKAERLSRSIGSADLAPSELSSSGTPSVADGDGQSLSSFQTESFMHTSQMGASGSDPGLPQPRKTKAQLWSELKTSSITRSFTLLYTLALLTLLTRIQLNLLGRRNYLSSVVSLATRPVQDSTIGLENRDDDRGEESYGTDFETNRKFLTFSWWLLHRGWRDIMNKVDAAVKEVFGPLNPREDVTFEELSQLVVEVRKKVEGSTEEERRTHQWLPFLLPPRDQEAFVLHESGVDQSPAGKSSEPSLTPLTDNFPHPSISASTSASALRRLIDEASDLIDSPTATHVLTLLLDALFSHLTDQVLLSQAFKLPLSAGETAPRVQEIPDDPSANPADPIQAKAKLANILAVVTRQAHAIGSGVPNEYVQAMEEVREVEAFAAVVYSCNWEFEGIGKTMEGQATGESGTTEAPAEAVESAQEASGGLVHATWGLLESVWGRVAGT